jgi:YgiT-type zinc finger domain-containing protein
MGRFQKEKPMRCVVCKGEDIVLKTVDEQISVGDDIVLIPLTLPVCSQCGERYYDRRAMRIIEEVRAKSKQSGLVVEEVGKVLRTKVAWYRSTDFTD